MQKNPKYPDAKVVILVTNPLHYQYFLQDTWPEWLYVVISQKGPANDYYAQDQPRVIRVDSISGPSELYAASSPLFPDETKYFAWKTFAFDGEALGNSNEQVRDLENKVIIRSTIDSSLFPKHQIIAPGQEVHFDQLCEQLDAKGLVVQTAVSTGGMGTFMIKSEEELLDAVERHQLGQSGEYVVSERIPGISYGLQCYFNGQNSFFPPYWHKDLVGIGGVAKPDSPKTQYSGAIIENMPVDIHAQVQKIVDAFTPVLEQNGYIGIFGIDLILGEDGTVYLVEINPRFTAVSHLYATLMRSLGATDYITTQLSQLMNVSDQSVAQVTSPIDSMYYYIKLQNLLDKPVTLSATCKVGVYNEKLEFKNSHYGIDGLDQDGDIAVIPELATGREIQPGSRGISIVGKGNPLENSGTRLTDHYLHVANSVRAKFTD